MTPQKPKQPLVPSEKRKRSRTGKTPCGLCLPELDAFYRAWKISPTEGLGAELRDLVKAEEKTGGLRVPQFLDFWRKWKIPADNPLWQKLLRHIENREAVGKPYADASGQLPQGADGTLSGEAQQKIRECEEGGWTGMGLMAADIPPPKWVIPGLLIAGLNSLAGLPKRGKTVLAMQMAKAVCGGSTIFDRKAKKGKVLFIQRELGPGRFKQRLREQGWTEQELANLTIRLKWPPWGKGGREHLLTEIASGKYTLVIIDTLSKLVGKEVDLMHAGDVMVLYDELQAAAQKSGTAVLVIVHHRKRTIELPADVVEDISGSINAAGGCEHLLGLYRFLNDPRATLGIVGYDLEDEKLALIIAGPTKESPATPLLWHADESGITVESQTRMRGGADEHILNALRDNGKPMTAAEIAPVIGKPTRYVSDRLLHLRRRGHIEVVDMQGNAGVYDLRSSLPLPRRDKTKKIPNI